MKLATLKDSSRDGHLAVVSRNLTQAHFATGIASTLQQLLDDWNFVSPQLEDLSARLNAGKLRHAFAFDPRHCMAPLPRAFQWLHGAAWPGPADVASRPESPLLVQSSSDDFLGATDDAVVADAGWGIDFEAEVVVMTGDVAREVAPDAALDTVRLLLLANRWCLRDWTAAGAALGAGAGVGAVQSRPATAFSPVAVTPDEAGDAWRGGRLHLSLHSHWNGRLFGSADAGSHMNLHFGQLIAHAAHTRRLRAGSLVGGAGAFDSAAGGHPSGGHRSVAALRAIESSTTGAAVTGYLQHGDIVRVEMPGRDGLSLFGAIDQRVRPGPQAAGAPA